MADILNFNAIAAAKRARAKLNILAAEPNAKTMLDPDWIDPEDGTPQPKIQKYTDLEWLNELVWTYLKTRNSRGAEILAKQAAEPVEDIRTP